MAALLLLLALVAVVLFWAVAERYFKRRFRAMTTPVGPGGAAAQIPWEQKIAVVRRHELLNWGVAFALIAILTGFVFVGHAHYVSVIEDTAPPQVVPAGREVSGPAADTVLYWSARFPGGRMWPAVEDGGYVLVRAIRGRYDQYLLFAPTGALMWSGERVAYGPAPRVAVRSWPEGEGEGRGEGEAEDEGGVSDGQLPPGVVAIAVEDPAGGGARLLVFGPDGLVRYDEPLHAYPDGDAAFFSIKTAGGELRSRPASPDGRWLVDSRLLPSVSFITSHLHLFGPRPAVALRLPQP